MFIYIHVPFCQSRCIYCDFYVVLQKYGGQDAYVDALCREIDLRWTTPAEPLTPIETLYFGGGTPSLLSAKAYQRILEHLSRYAPFSDEAELTLETNPDAVLDPIKDYQKVGFNRLSVGVQSFQNPELKKLSRIHTAERAVDFIKEAQDAGFNNCSIDLMYGIPLQTLASWQSTLETTIALQVPHVSMYGLKVEEKTPLERLSQTGAYPLPDDEMHIELYQNARKHLETVGLKAYEFSNMAKPGFESRHNQNYWNNQSFWAFGPAAHGYISHTRYETVRDLSVWLENPLSGNVQPCSTQEQLENTLIFGLRRHEGVSISALEETYSIDFEAQFGKALEPHLRKGLLQRENDQLFIPVNAIPYSNEVLSEFINL